MARSVLSRSGMNDEKAHPAFAVLLRERLTEAIVLADDLSMRELERLAGTCVGLVQGLIAGTKPNPGMVTVCAWAEVLGVSLDWLAGRTDTSPSAEHVRAAVLEARKRYAVAHLPRGRKGAGQRVLAKLAKRTA